MTFYSWSQIERKYLPKDYMDKMREKAGRVAVLMHNIRKALRRSDIR